MHRTLVAKIGREAYYVEDSGMGGFLNPPGDAEHDFHLVVRAGGREVGGGSLRYMLQQDQLPAVVRDAIERLLAEHPGERTEEWVASVYRHFAHCYSPDGINRNVGDCVIYSHRNGNYDSEQHANPERHLAVLFIRTFDPTHAPRLDLIRQRPAE